MAIEEEEKRKEKSTMKRKIASRLMVENVYLRAEGWKIEEYLRAGSEREETSDEVIVIVIIVVVLVIVVFVVFVGFALLSTA